MESESKQKKVAEKSAMSQSPSNSDQARNYGTKSKQIESIKFANVTVQARKQSNLGNGLIVQTKQLDVSNLTDKKLPVIVQKNNSAFDVIQPPNS